MYLILSEKKITNNWDAIKADPCNNRPDIETASEYISEAKSGRVTAGGAKVVIPFNAIVFHKSWINSKPTMTYPSSSGLEVLLVHPKKIIAKLISGIYPSAYNLPIFISNLNFF